MRETMKIPFYIMFFCIIVLSLIYALGFGYYLSHPRLALSPRESLKYRIVHHFLQHDKLVHDIEEACDADIITQSERSQIEYGMRDYDIQHIQFLSDDTIEVGESL